MRKFNLSLTATCFLALATTAMAENLSPLADTPHFKTCRAESKAKADAYVQDYIVPATDEDTAPPKTYVAIVYGQKFIAPLHPTTNGDLQLHGLGEVISKRREVYREEMRRCLGYVDFRLALRQHIFIFE